jgi:hypothetical protein
MNGQKTSFWIRISLFNLLIVAAIGVLMRFKIGFEFPFLDQKHLQHAHSHFAFAGWISQTIMALMVHVIHLHLSAKRLKSYNTILSANLISAYGMLVAFAIQGYGMFSIFFSSMSIIVAFSFAYYFFKDLKKTPTLPSKIWFEAALFFNILSAFGTLALSVMMATKNLEQHSYLAAVYWYLHFQYNGWFLFACMGLFVSYVHQLFPEFVPSKNIFWLFTASCVPAYGLSILWLNLPIWIYCIIVLAAFAQMLGWLNMVWVLKKVSFLKNLSTNRYSNLLFSLIAIAVTIKFGLQLGSTIPSVSKLAFGFRPIVIAYLHLVLLAITTVFLLTYLYAEKLLRFNRVAIVGLIVFVVGVYANELALAVQGVTSISYTVVPHIDIVLFGISLFIFLGLLLMSFVQLFSSNTSK